MTLIIIGACACVCAAFEPNFDVAKVQVSILYCLFLLKEILDEIN